MKIIYLFFILLINPFSIIAQRQNFSPKEFYTSGDAIIAGAQCFQLTSDNLWQGGTIWYKTPISLANPLEMEVDLSFGCEDDGADGMVFIFHPELRNGRQGEGIGFGGLRPSFGIEMDTYENHHLDDPWYDHLALIENGAMHHFYSVSDAVPILPGKKNIEDCQSHRIKIIWKPSLKKLSIFVDGNLRLAENYDIINNVFDGNPNVFWGISAATGGKTNEHTFCLEKLDFTTVGTFSTAIKERLLLGEDYTLDKVDFLSGKTTLQQPSFNELDKLVDFLESNPEHHIYISGHTDDQGSASSNKAISKKRADAVMQYLIKKRINKDRIKTTGAGEQFPKVENSSPENRLINRRVDIKIYKPRV